MKNALMPMLLCGLLSASSAHAAIFGSDDRAPLLASSPKAELGRATAVAVLSANIEPDEAAPGTYKIEVDNLSGLLCKGERFAADQSMSYACSGFLVAPDLIATAGHCMVNVGESINEPGMYCEAFGWLFDYQQGDSGVARTRGIPAENFYKCKKIIYAVRDEAAPFRDYALVQLERPVVGRTPLKLADPAKKVSGLLHMIGYPLGTPMKLTSNGMVTHDDPARQSLVTNLDAFEGNSGSAVFNAQNEVLGILVGGNPSQAYFARSGESCSRYNHCDLLGKSCEKSDGEKLNFPGFDQFGSEVQRIAPILELMKKL
jgi:V8-like Glu-specific endopeptidase